LKLAETVKHFPRRELDPECVGLERSLSIQFHEAEVLLSADPGGSGAVWSLITIEKAIPPFFCHCKK